MSSGNGPVNALPLAKSVKFLRFGGLSHSRSFLHTLTAEDRFETSLQERALYFLLPQASTLMPQVGSVGGSLARSSQEGSVDCGSQTASSTVVVDVCYSTSKRTCQSQSASKILSATAAILIANIRINCI